MKLYELSQNYNELIAYMNSEEMEEDDKAAIDDTLAAIEESFADKVENICKLRANCKADMAGLDEEIKRLTERKRALGDKVKSLENYLADQMKVTEKEKVKTELFTIGFRKSTAVDVFDLDAVPDMYKKVTVAPDKIELKKALDGEDIPGARIVTNYNLAIR